MKLCSGCFYPFVNKIELSEVDSSDSNNALQDCTAGVLRVLVCVDDDHTKAGFDYFLGHIRDCRRMRDHKPEI